MFVLFFLFICEAKKKKSTKKRRKHAIVSYVFTSFSRFLFFGITKLFKPRILGSSPSNNARLLWIRCLLEQAINVSETASKRLLFDRREFSRSGRTIQLISERKSSTERFFAELFCRHKKVPELRIYIQIIHFM